MQWLSLTFLFLFFTFPNRNDDRWEDVKTEDGHIIKRHFNDKGVLIYEQQFLTTDTGLLEDGFSRYYSDNGDTLESVFLDSGRIDGVSKLYYPNGRIKQKLHWRYNAMWGPQYEYYENGSLRLFIHYLKPVAAFTVTDERLMIHFNEANEVDTFNGHAFTVYTEEKYKKTDTADVDFLCINDPEGMKGQLVVAVKGKNGVPSDTFSQADGKKFFNLFIFRYRYPCIKGSAKLEAKYLLQTGRNKKPIVFDSQVIQVKVEK